MKIDNAQLAAFAAVIQTGSFESAALQLHVTPSAVSQRIKLLEERLGQVLILRGIPCLATQAGKPLLRYAEQLALLETETLAEMGVASDSSSTHLRIPVVVNADSLDGWFLPVVASACRDLGVMLDVRVEDQDHSALWLRDGTVMAAVSASAEPIQGCQVEALGIMRYLALASSQFVKTYFPEGVDAASLQRAPMMVFNNKDALQQVFAAQLCHASISPPVLMLPSTRGFIEIAKSGVAWGMIPQDMVEAELAKKDLVEIDPGRHLDIPLYWHCWRRSSPALSALGLAVRKAASAVLLS